MSDEAHLHVLVADDERHVRESLCEYLDAFDEVDTIDVVSDGEAAAQRIQETAYDLAFLDVKMPVFTGIEVVEEVGADQMPPTVFVTAFEEYAHRAFDLAAVDYLLKPFDRERLRVAFERALRTVALEQAEEMATQYRRLMDETGPAARRLFETLTGEEEAAAAENGRSGTEHLERITVKNRDEIQVVPVDEVQCITAEGVYVEIHTADESYLRRERLYEIEEQLDPSEFIRIHRSTIVRLDCISSLKRRSSGDYLAELDDGKRYRVSRSRQDELLQRLKNGSIG